MKHRVLPIIAFLVVFTGCHSLVKIYPYRFVAVNHGETLIKGIIVNDSSGVFDYGCGDLGPGAYAAHAGPMDTPPDDRFGITWVDHLGEMHRHVLDLTQRLRPGFSGEIVLVFSEGRLLDVMVNNAQGHYPIPKQTGAQREMPERRPGE